MIRTDAQNPRTTRPVNHPQSIVTNQCSWGKPYQCTDCRPTVKTPNPIIFALQKASGRGRGTIPAINPLLRIGVRNCLDQSEKACHNTPWSQRTGHIRMIRIASAHPRRYPLAISTSPAAGAGPARPALARVPMWIATWPTMPRTMTPTANQYGAYKPTCSHR